MKHTPGAMAAVKWLKERDLVHSAAPADEVAAAISRETHDIEMLEALQILSTQGSAVAIKTLDKCHLTYDPASTKMKAREYNVALYKKLTGRSKIPAKKQYWTLAALQTNSPTSEINQMVNMGFLKKEQFVGVDREVELIRQNRKFHPSATWLSGDWSDVILAAKDFDPACIYLDTENIAGRISLNLTASTMRLCPVGTVILVNVCQSARFVEPMAAEEFLRELSRRVPNITSWIPKCGVLSFEYASFSTLMRTMAFMRGKE